VATTQTQSARYRGAIAALSTIIVVGGVALAVVSSSGWPAFKRQFLSQRAFRRSLPEVADGFLLNIKMFLIAEVFILVFALIIAVVRNTRGPAFFPFRLLGTMYVDVFRGVPTILVIYLLGLGIPSLGIDGLSSSEMFGGLSPALFWGVTALVLSYSAYVAEVYRAGIESVHPSQRAAARSLGLTNAQAQRFVILPQAIRRVIPPLLNDFVSLQKDTALVSVLGPLEAMRRAQIDAAGHFNYTAYMVAAGLFLVTTIPLARFTDWLMKRQAAGGPR
jgi:polar amino acid transport system permease protein